MIKLIIIIILIIILVYLFILLFKSEQKEKINNLEGGYIKNYKKRKFKINSNNFNNLEGGLYKNDFDNLEGGLYKNKLNVLLPRYNLKDENISYHTNDNIIYRILIMHEPDFLTKFDYSNYDLVLAGHSHNGQVRLPFIGAIILPPNAKKYYNEYYNLGNTKLYISSGLGTSNIDFRLFNRPSINFYRITNK